MNTQVALPMIRDSLEETTRQIWQAMFSIEVMPSESSGEGLECGAVASVDGVIAGTIVVSCASSAAAFMAEQMFARPEGEATAEEKTDALLEVVNITAGNLQSILPPPSSLGLPRMIGGELQVIQLAAQVDFVTPHGPLRVGFIQSGQNNG